MPAPERVEIDQLPPDQKDLVADLVGQYYDWYTGNGGTHSDVLLARTDLTPMQRKALLTHMDDLNVIMGMLGKTGRD